jgi:hypothetical protein
MFKDYPGEIYAARKDSPMVIGVSGGETFLASDVPAVLKYTRDIYYIDNLQSVRILPGEVHFYDLNGDEVQMESTHISWDAEAAEKAIVESIDNLYTKYRDLSDEAKAHYEAFTKGVGSVRIAPHGAGYKVTAFTDKADKAYKLIICGYDADENLISTKLVDGKTKDSIYYTHLIDSVDENAASVKVFFWEGFKTLLPYAYNVAELK